MRALVVSLVLSSCFGLSGVRAQQPPVSYAAEPFVVERLESIYRMQADGTGVREKTVEVQVQTESALKDMAVISVPFAANSEHVEWVYARIRHKDGSTTETPSAGAIEIAEPVTREAPFYSDLKESQLPLKDLRVGDRVEWKWRVIRNKAEAANQFWGEEMFDRTGVVLAESVVLDVPKDVAVTVWSPKAKAVESTEGDRHIYRWTTDNKKPTVGAEATAAAEAEKKRVRTADEELDDRYGKLPDVAWTTFKSWEAVGAWYRGLEGERMMPDADIKAKVAQLTAGKTTDREKVEAVYSYVATQIHYIGVAFGVGRYQPHSAGDVLGNQYGDCKDKHTLLAAMLEALGLHPDAVLIGVEIRFNQPVPSPAAFNHLITRVQLDGKPVWLDTTAEVAPFGMLVAQTRDHEALVIPSSGAAQVERTPARAPFADTMVMESNGTLDVEGVSNSRLTLKFRGDEEVLLRSVIRQVSPAQYDKVAQQLCSSMGYGGTASHMDVSRVDDTTEPLTISFDYKRVKAGDWDNLRTVPQLSPGALPVPDEKDPPVEAIELGAVRVESSSSAMLLPEGWTAELPEAVHEKSAWATFDQTYRFEKGTLFAQRRTEILVERVPQSDWKAYGKFAERSEKGGDRFVQLVRKSSAGKGTKASAADKKADKKIEVVVAGPEMSSEEAERTINQAYESIQGDDPKGAKPLLDRVQAGNPKQLGLWSAYGALAMRQGALSESIQDYEKELQLHPSALQVYAVLATVQLYAGRRPDAKESLKRWADAAPESADPALRLANMQIEDGAFADAAATAAAAIARRAAGEEPNERLQLLLGRAQLKAGIKDKGHETLTALLKKTDDADLMNDTAYELADAGLELALAEQATRTALDRMEAQTRTWTLDENVAELHAKTLMLQATWDTMGWIKFREGKLAEAEGFVKASWTGRQSVEVGGHLAEIALAKGDRNAALADFELAAVAAPAYDAMGVRSQQSPQQKEMEKRAAALEKAGAQSTTYDTAATLERMRKLPLGPGSDGVAEYKMLVSSQGVLRAEPVGEKAVPDALARLKRAKMAAFLPPGSDARLMLDGMLNCHEGTCELVLLKD